MCPSIQKKKIWQKEVTKSNNEGECPNFSEYCLMLFLVSTTIPSSSLLIPISLFILLLPKNPSPPLLNCICDTEIIEQPLVRMPSIVSKILIPTLALRTCVCVSTTPLVDSRLAKLSNTNLDALVIGFGFGHGVCDAQLREFRTGAVRCGHCRGLGELRHAERVEGGGSGSSAFD